MTVRPLDLQFRPKLRQNLAVDRDSGSESDMLTLSDLRQVAQPIQISPALLELLRFFDGVRTLAQIHAEFTRRHPTVSIDAQSLLKLTLEFDRCLFLEGPTLRALLDAPDREPSCIGTYSENPAEIRQQLAALLTSPGGPGRPKPCSRVGTESRLRAVLAPHMDYGRGGVTYGWAFHELVERTDARLFVIIATSHYSPAPYTLTRQNFRTPLGVVPTDQAFVKRLENAYGPGLFDDPLAHVPEHSIELEVLLLQYLYEDIGPIRIVPLLVGSYFQYVESNLDPASSQPVQRMASALREAEAAAEEPVCYIISGDLAHIGPKFDDPDPVNATILQRSRRQDERLLERLSMADAAGYFRIIAEEADVRRICGLPPTHLTLLASNPNRGRILHYQQYVHPEGYESVSFAAAAFETVP